MTPEQLSDVFVAALADLVSEGVVDLPDGVPSQVLVERPKVKEHGDYATNVALQLGKRAGLNPRDLATKLADRLTEHPDIASVEVAGPGFLNVRVAAGAQGVVASDVVRAGDAYGTSDVNAGRQHQPRVHQRQPHRPAAPRPHPLGRRGRRDRPGARGHRGIRHPRVLHQRPRCPDGQVRRVPHGPRPRPGTTRGRLPRRVRQRARRPGRRAGPDRARAAGRRAERHVP